MLSFCCTLQEEFNILWWVAPLWVASTGVTQLERLGQGTEDSYCLLSLPTTHAGGTWCLRKALPSEGGQKSWCLYWQLMTASSSFWTYRWEEHTVRLVQLCIYGWMVQVARVETFGVRWAKHCKLRLQHLWGTDTNKLNQKGKTLMTSGESETFPSLSW